MRRSGAVSEGNEQLGTTASEQAGDAPGGSSALPHWLAVAVAPRAELVGHRMLAHGLVVGRGAAAMFREDAQLSKRHATFTETDGGLDVADLGSRNGTWCDGRRVAKKRLAVGDYVRVGAFGFVVARAPGVRALRSDEVLIGDSHVFQRVLAELEATAPSDSPALVWGPAGAGRSTFCERVHARSGRQGALVWVDARGLSEDALRVALFDAIGKAPGGTLVVEAIDTVSPHSGCNIEAALSAALRARCRFLATAKREDALAPFLPGKPWTVRMPPLSERRDDIPLLLEHLTKRLGATLALSPKQRERVVTRTYDGDVGELAALIERAYRSPPELRDALFGVTSDETAPDAPVMLARSGQWVVANGTRVDLSDSPTLAAVLRSLVNGHLAGRRCVPTSEVVAESWSDERILPRAASNRIYVAMNSLRRIGLRGIIVRGDGGYTLEGNFVLSD